MARIQSPNLVYVNKVWVHCCSTGVIELRRLVHNARQ